MNALLGLALAALDPTEAYEYFIITAIPAGITLLFTPILNDNVPQVVVVGKPTLATTRLAVSCAMLVALAVNLARLCYSETLLPLQTVFATVLSFLASLAVVGSLQLSRRYAFPSTTFHALLLAATLLYDLAVMRHSEQRLGGIGRLQFTMAALKSCYVLISLTCKSSVLVLQPGPAVDREADSPSLPSLWSCVSWPGLISVPGLRDDASWTDLPEPSWTLCSETIFRQFMMRWDKVDKNSNQALAKAITSTLGRMFLSIVPLRLFHVVLTVAQPLLLWHILTTAFHDNVAFSTIFANILAAAILWIGIPLVKLAFTKQSDCVVVSTRAILIATIYDKMMRLRIMDVQNSSVLSQLMDGMRSVELLIDSTQDVASAIIQVWLGLCLIWPFIGNASLLIFVPTTMVAVGSWFTGKQELRRRNLVTERRKTRVALTSSILKQLHSIQMMGLGPALAMYLNSQRELEVDALLEERSFRMREFSLLAFNHSMTPALVIAGYLYLVQNSLSFGAAETFTCFLLIRIVSNAFNIAVDRLTCGQQGSQILARVQEFLLLDEIVDKRLLVALEGDDGNDVGPIGATPTIELVRATVMSNAGEVILLDATMRAFRYGVTMVFGPVACGKSTLLRLILGEVAPSSGRITVSNGPMVYCDQEVWLPFVSIRDSIIGSAIYDPAWYAKLTDACSLGQDFEQLPYADMTVVGGPRCSLSLSLRQRISLARAVYEKPTTIILDDPLNAVGYGLASQIYRQLFGAQGIVFKWECTVVMATNNFGHLQFADAVFTVGYDGRVTRETVTDYTSTANTRAVLGDSNGLFSCAMSTEETLLPPSMGPSQLQEPDEDEQIHMRSRDSSLYSYFQHPAGRSLIWSWTTAVTAAAIMKKMPEIFWGVSLSSNVLSSACVAGYAVFGLSNIVCNRMAAHLYITQISAKSSIALHWRLIKTLITATPEFVSRANPVSTLKLFDEHLETISRGFPITLMQCCFMVISISVDALIVSSCAKYTVTFVVALWALLSRIRGRYLPFAQRLHRLEAQALASVTARCSETAAGVEHIRAFQQQPAFYQDFFAALTLAQRPYYHVFEAKRQLEYTVALFTAVAGLVTVGLAHVYPQSSSQARLALALVSIVDLTGTLKSMAMVWAKLDEGLGAVFRIRRFCDETPVEYDDEKETLPSRWPSRRAFDFFRVVAENDTGEGDSTNKPLVDASLDGTQKIVVSGRTGSGQGSLILAVLRMIKYSGAIRIDDVNVKNVPRVALRSSITTITRQGLELDGTLRANLDPVSMMERYFSDADLISMLHRVRLWDAAQRRGGLDASMRRMRFSPAQRQLLSLARGALHRRREDTRVVLIDSAVTARLDEHTRSRMNDFIDGEFAACTVLMVAHDLEAIRTADTIITVEGGAITGVLERNDSG